MRRLQCQALVGGSTESIFPRVEELITGDGDHWNALQYVAHRKNMERYQSVMDFLFCELHPRWCYRCFRFYEGEGPQLRKQISDQQRDEYEKRLLKALEVAYELFQEQRRRNWTWYSAEVEKAIAAAA